MVDGALNTRVTGFSSLDSAENDVEPVMMRRGGEMANLDLERNTTDNDDYDGHGQPGKTFWKLHMRPPDDDLPQYVNDLLSLLL